MGEKITFEAVLAMVRQLPAVEKARLIERISFDIEQSLQHRISKERTSLRGVWKGTDISEEDIEEARREMWGNFPRDDI